MLRHANAAGIPDWTYPTVNSYDVPGALAPASAEDQAMVKQFLGYGMPATTSAVTTGGHSLTFSLAAKILGRRRPRPRGGWRCERPQHHAGLPGRDRLLVVLRGPVRTARAPARADPTKCPS